MYVLLWLKMRQCERIDGGELRNNSGKKIKHSARVRRHILLRMYQAFMIKLKRAIKPSTRHRERGQTASWVWMVAAGAPKQAATLSYNRSSRFSWVEPEYAT